MKLILRPILSEIKSFLLIIFSHHFWFAKYQSTVLLSPSSKVYLGCHPSSFTIKELSIASVRSSIALVSQEPILFDMSIHDNILYGKPDSSDDEVIKAAKAAAADEFINELPDKYKTIVGEKGYSLSGGQKQRISIARAFLKDAPILLLDEATSSLDTESEHLVQKAISIPMKDRTTLVIAHRLSTIINSDQIIVLDSGKVVETGTHEELLNKDGVYKKLYEREF